GADAAIQRGGDGRIKFYRLWPSATGPGPCCKLDSSGLERQLRNRKGEMTVANPARRWETSFARARDSLSPTEWRRAFGMTAVIVGLHVLGFVLLFAAVSGHYHITGKETLGIGTGTLAYTLGLRHAFDADHISAIDNTTRKLMAEGKRPLSVGFFFSLGHSSVVFALAVLLNFGIRALNSGVQDEGSGLHHYTGLIGTLVSGVFLYVIALLNVIILVSIVRMFIDMRRGLY